MIRCILNVITRVWICSIISLLQFWLQLLFFFFDVSLILQSFTLLTALINSQTDWTKIRFLLVILVVRNVISLLIYTSSFIRAVVKTTAFLDLMVFPSSWSMQESLIYFTWSFFLRIRNFMLIFLLLLLFEIFIYRLIYECSIIIIYGLNRRALKWVHWWILWQ